MMDETNCAFKTAADVVYSNRISCEADEISRRRVVDSGKCEGMRAFDWMRHKQVVSLARQKYDNVIWTQRQMHLIANYQAHKAQMLQ